MTDLTYRERFQMTLDHRQVDRPPMDLGGTDMTDIDGGPRRLAPALGLAGGGDDAAQDEAVLQALDIDIRSVGGILAPESSLTKTLSKTEMSDCWGIRYRFNGHHYEAEGRPLAGATLEDLERYPWPDPDRIPSAQLEHIESRARRLYENTPYVVCGRHPYYGVLELGCWMCGFDDFLCRLAGEPEFVLRFFEIVRNYQRRMDEIYYGRIGRYIHFATCGDDFGTQRAPFISEALFREQILPFLSGRIEHIRKYTDAAFFHHSCGAIRPLIPGLIEAGVQILNPIQPNAAGMEPSALKRDFGDRLTFYGGVDTQLLLPSGTPEEVAAGTRALIATLGETGGYVLSAAHVIQPDVPVDNVLALFRTGKESVL
jgi:uroporphyrinogen decarboxylase